MEYDHTCWAVLVFEILSFQLSACVHGARQFDGRMPPNLFWKNSQCSLHIFCCLNECIQFGRCWWNIIFTKEHKNPNRKISIVGDSNVVYFLFYITNSRFNLWDRVFFLIFSYSSSRLLSKFIVFAGEETTTILSALTAMNSDSRQRNVCAFLLFFSRAGLPSIYGNSFCWIYVCAIESTPRDIWIPFLFALPFSYISKNSNAVQRQCGPSPSTNHLPTLHSLALFFPIFLRFLFLIHIYKIKILAKYIEIGLYIFFRACANTGGWAFGGASLCVIWKSTNINVSAQHGTNISL